MRWKSTTIVIAIAVLLVAGCKRSNAPKQEEANRAATITANPNPVPAGPGAGSTTITWDTGDGSIGEVYVSVNDGEEKLFGRNSKGSREAPWINSRGVCEFRLYRGTNHKTSNLVSSVAVTQNKR